MFTVPTVEPGISGWAECPPWSCPLVLGTREIMTREGQAYPQSHSNKRTPDLLTPGQLKPTHPSTVCPVLLPWLQIKATAAQFIEHAYSWVPGLSLQGFLKQMVPRETLAWCGPDWGFIRAVAAGFLLLSVLRVLRIPPCPQVTHLIPGVTRPDILAREGLSLGISIALGIFSNADAPGRRCSLRP